jgi:hypothetical protein
MLRPAKTIPSRATPFTDNGRVGSRARRRDRDRRAAGGPQVHVKVIAPVDLGGLAALVKPAVLYADSVTIHSPSAALLHGVIQFAELTHPADQLHAILEVARQAPNALKLDFDPEAAAKLTTLLRMSPQQRARLKRTSGANFDLNAIDEMTKEISRIWAADMPAVVEDIIETTSSAELVTAIHAGAVTVAPLGDRSSADHVARSVTAATSSRPNPEPDPMFDGFLETIVDVVSGTGDGFPLLDGDAAELVKSMESESIVMFDGTTATRSSEVDAASRFMGFLPYFPEMPMDEVLDLKLTIGEPLIRFRGEMVKLAQDFARPIDDGFVRDVENAWRGAVAPALADVREALGQQGLLKGAATVVRGDVRRLAAEAGGVLAASHANLLKLSSLVTLATVAGLPALDTLGIAVNERMKAERDVAKQGFYFLHRIDEEARRRL